MRSLTNINMALEFVNKTNNDIWLSIEKVAELKSVSGRAIRKAISINKDKYIIRTVTGNKGGNGGERYEILLSSLEPEIQIKYFNTHYLDITPKSNDTYATPSISHNHPNSHTLGGVTPPLFLKKLTLVKADTDIKNEQYIPEAAKNIALARLDLINAWQKYRSLQSAKNKNTDKEFIGLYNSGIPYPEIYEVIGKTSLATLYRWRKDYEQNKDFKTLIPNYNYGSMFFKQTKLSDAERKWFLDLLLCPNKISVGNAVRLIKFVLERQNINDVCCYSTYKRFADWYKKVHFDIWTLMREGQKALRDKVEPYITRNPELLNVGDALVADGHTLDFEVINPVTGKPCRATLVAYLDWASFDIAGYEIMLSENTQCIASALRNSIIRLGKMPKIAYQDNGKAFRSRFFTSKNLDECGFYGIFGNLGIVPVFAQPYNARAKVIERFFREFTQTCESLMPSYVGNSPVNKPAYKNRNEKFHKKMHNKIIPTLDEAKLYIEKWLEFYRAQPCPHHKDKTIGQVFYEGIGDGVDVDTLDDLMLAQKTRKTGTNGIRFLNNNYYSPELYGLKDAVVIKYSLFDLSYVKIYTKKGGFICKAHTKLALNPMARLLGDAKDMQSVKEAIELQRRLEQKTIQKAIKIKSKAQNQLSWQKNINLIASKSAPEPAEAEEKYEFICDYIPHYERAEEEYKFNI